MKKHEEHRYVAQVIPYFLGELSANEREAFERHLRTGCHLCMMELAETEEALHGLPLLLPRLPAPFVMRQKILTRTATAARAASAVMPKTAASSAARPWLGYVTLLLIAAIVLGFWIFSENLISTIDSQAAEIVRLRGEVRHREELLAILQAPKIEIVALNGLKASPTGYGKIIWDPAKKVALFQVSNLPAIPEEKDYQLWVIRNKKPVSAGVFAVRDERDRENMFKVLGLDIASRNEVDAFAVTLEPKGGLARPSGEMYLLGSSR